MTYLARESTVGKVLALQAGGPSSSPRVLKKAGCGGKGLQTSAAGGREEQARRTASQPACLYGKYQARGTLSQMYAHTAY